MITKVCKHCNMNFNFEKGKHFKYANHVANCDLSPNALKRKKLYELQKQKTILKNTIIHKGICKNCNKPFTRSYRKGWSRPPLCCSNKCSHKRTFNTKQRNNLRKINKQKFEQKLLKHKDAKVFVTKQGIRILMEKRFCVICNSTFFNHNKKTQTCSKLCLSKLLSQKLKGKTGGVRKKGGTGKISYYTNKNGEKILCQSSYEYDMCNILDNLNLLWERNKTGFPYLNKSGQKRKYYPDFYLPLYNSYIETKGYMSSDVEHKIKSANVPNLILLLSKQHGGIWEDVKQAPNILFKILKGHRC